MRYARLLLLLLAVVVAGSSACSSDDPVAAAEAKKVEVLESDAVPDELLGLDVAAEDVGGAVNVRHAYVEGVSLHSLRDGETLQATLQISKFRTSDVTKKAQFRSTVASQIGSTVPKAYRVGGTTVYLTSGNRQKLAVWFKDDHMFVLATREEYQRPRALLRAALEIEP